MASLQLPNCKKKSAAHKNGFEVLVFGYILVNYAQSFVPIKNMRISNLLKSDSYSVCIIGLKEFQMHIICCQLPRWRLEPMTGGAIRHTHAFSPLSHRDWVIKVKCDQETWLWLTQHPPALHTSSHFTSK